MVLLLEILGGYTSLFSTGFNLAAMLQIQKEMELLGIDSTEKIQSGVMGKEKPPLTGSASNRTRS